MTICAVGRLRPGPEAALVEDYLARFGRSGRALGLGPAQVVEVVSRRGSGPEAEAPLIEAAVPRGARVVALDERGVEMGSEAFAGHLRGLAEEGTRDLAFLIGGAAGLAPDLKGSADLRLSLGAMVWPHMLVRAMLAEQLYRAASILAGSPYHRGEGT